jgi:hypothetical protein
MNYLFIKLLYSQEENMRKMVCILFTILSLYSISLGQVVKIPFELYRNKYILIYLCINNNKDTVCFYFDTGATSTLLDSTKAANLGLQPDYEQSVSGAGGRKSYKIVLNQTILVSSELKIDNTHIVLDDLSRLQHRLEKKFDGIIGYSILKDYKTKIDFDNKVIELYPFNAPIDTNKYATINFDFLRGIPIPQFPITIELKNGRKLSDTVFFDSGAGLSLLVNTPFKKKNNLLESIGKTIISESDNLSSKSIQQEAVIKSLQISQFTFGEMPISLSSDTAGVSSYDKYLGILGAEIIKRFNVISDYSRKKIYLKPNSLYNTPIEYDLSGIRLKLENGKVKVSSVVKESEAYEKGLRENDTIVSIDNLTESRIDTYREMLKQENKEVRIQYESASGQIKKIKIYLKKLI